MSALLAGPVGVLRALRRWALALAGLYTAITRPFARFVAMRYLAGPIHLSRLALGLMLVTGAIGGGLLWLVFSSPQFLAKLLLVDLELSPERALNVVQILSYVMIGAFAAAGLAFLVFAVRIFCTFYTTVSVVGVTVGTAALVIVLSVMNGFEGDLRRKILGSNAHIQVSKEDGAFTEWEEIRARVERVPGVVASTPFATSEVVIAANSNYHNVIIKGIDVDSAVKVTALERNLVDKDGLDKLAPLVPEPVAPEPVLAPPPDPSQPVVDPAPSDLPGSAEPIDYSGGEGDGPAPLAAGGATTDPAPDDFADGQVVDGEVPADLSGATPSPRPSTGTSRIATLPGILVGRELVKTIHLYPGQEVRVVSPLADPMNPDANGTPIPFNRDYRVAGEFFTGMYEYDLKLVYVTLDSLQRFLRLGDAVDGIEVRISSPDDVDRVVARIAAELGPAYRVQGWRELNRQLFSALKLEKVAMFIVLAIIILVAGFSIVGNLIMIVVEKGRQIALLKTLGASDTEVVGLFVLQGAIIGLVGSLLGVALGLGACWYLSAQGVPINANVYYIDRLPVAVDPLVVAIVFAAGVLISIGATIYPAILASQLRPAWGLKQS